MSLADALFDREPASNLVLRDGIVAAVSPLTITVPPSTVASPAAALDPSALAVGDFVQVLVQGANRLVVSRVAATRRTYTPTASNAGFTAVTLTVNHASYYIASGFCHVTVSVTVASNSAGTGTIIISLPVAATSSNIVVGTIRIDDANGADFAGVAFIPTGVDGLALTCLADNTAVPTFQLATGDTIRFSASYPIA